MFWERARLQSLLSAAEGRRSEPQQMPALAPEGRTSRSKNHLRSVSNTRWNHLLSRLKRVECLRKSPGELVESFMNCHPERPGPPSQPHLLAGVEKRGSAVCQNRRKLRILRRLRSVERQRDVLFNRLLASRCCRF